MKKILVVLALCGMLIPAPASAELDYNAVDIGHSTMSYSNSAQVQTELIVGISNSISKDVYLEAAYGAGSQSMGTSLGVKKKVGSLSVGAGYHTPLKSDVDAVAEGHIIQDSTKLAGTSTSVHGYDISAGIRALFIGGLEGTLAVVHASASNSTFSSTNTFLSAQFGFNLLPSFQMTSGIEFKRNITTSLGVRFFY
jgi:hypothetical protein